MLILIMLEKIQYIEWYDWLIVFGIGLLIVGIGINWKVENKSKIEILVKNIEEVSVVDI